MKTLLNINSEIFSPVEIFCDFSLKKFSMKKIYSDLVIAINWFKNDYPFKNLGKGQTVNPYLFERHCLNKMDSLTLRLSIYYRHN